MAIFTTVAECVRYYETCQTAFPILSEIVKPGDFNNWVRKLESCASMDDYFFLENPGLNLLYVSVLTGKGLETQGEAEPYVHCKRLLQKLSLYLHTFPALKANRVFRGKVQNLNQLSLLSTLSELSLAYQLAAGGQQVKFETKFKVGEASAEKDIDLSATDSNGELVHYEVYMPISQLEADGFLDLNQDDAYFEKRTKAKLWEKFGNGEITGLRGQIVLAINTAPFDTFRLKNLLSLTASDAAKLRTLIPPYMDGLLLFDDGFESDNSFKFVRRLMK